jgi:hypothetical protein
MTMGSSATMLSNLRFVVLAQYAADGSALVLTVRPRSVSGWWPAEGIGEVRFLLSGVVVARYGERQGFDVVVGERYCYRREWTGHLFVDLVPGG